MSSHQTFPAGEKPLSVLDVPGAKQRGRLAMVTACDAFSARIVDRAGADMVLVGGSLGMVMLGWEGSVSVTLDEMIRRSRAVMRGARRALVVADMPFMTCETGVKAALLNAGRLVRESGVCAVKLEGAFLPQIRALAGAGIPVMGHIGLTPQRAARWPDQPLAKAVSREAGAPSRCGTAGTGNDAGSGPRRGLLGPVHSAPHGSGGCPGRPALPSITDGAMGKGDTVRKRWNL